MLSPDAILIGYADVQIEYSYLGSEVYWVPDEIFVFVAAAGGSRVDEEKIKRFFRPHTL